MSETATRVRREFHFNGLRLGDPDPGMSPEDVKKMYASSGYPALTNASITGPEVKDGRHVYTFKQAVGTKG